MVRLFNVSIPTSILILVLADTVLLNLAFLLITPLTLFDFETYLLVENGWINILIVTFCIQIGLYFTDSYDSIGLPIGLLTQRLCFSLGIAFLVQSLLSYSGGELYLPRWTMVGGSFLALLIYPPWRRLYAALVHQTVPMEKVLFIGWSPNVQQIMQQLEERPEFSMKPMGYLDNREQPRGPLPEDDSSPPRLGSIQDLDKICTQTPPNRIVVGLAENQAPVQKLLHYRYSALIHVEEAHRLYERVFGRVATADLQAYRLLFSQEAGPRRFNLHLQKLYMPLLAAIALILASPVMLIVAIAVRLTSPGPIFFRQTRVGQNGRLFTLYKFRSMRSDAESKTGAVWAQKDDPRITPIGKWLRKLRLDELPQLLNVIRGDMSLVGPRPERPEFTQILEEKIPFFAQRLCVPPGITGWAQINHKYGDTLEDTIVKLEYDLYYIKNLSIELDFYIFFHTIKVMVLSRGSQ